MIINFFLCPEEATSKKTTSVTGISLTSRKGHNWILMIISHFPCGNYIKGTREFHSKFNIYVSVKTESWRLTVCTYFASNRELYSIFRLWSVVFFSHRLQRQYSLIFWHLKWRSYWITFCSNSEFIFVYFDLRRKSIKKKIKK